MIIFHPITFRKTIKLCLVFMAVMSRAIASDFYVSPSGSNSGTGSKSNPWRSLYHASVSVPTNGEHTIHLAAGTYIEQRISIRPGISVVGSGKHLTIIKPHPSTYYHPSSPGFGVDKFLFNLISSRLTGGNQVIKNFTIDGEEKKLHGGIYVENRMNVTLDNIKVQFVNFSGVWLMGVRQSVLIGLDLKNAAWGSTGWCSGALQITNSEEIEVSGFNIDESVGYGIKNLGQTENTAFSKIKIHDGRVSVSPKGLWNDGKAPNIAIEIWASSFAGTEIYNCYFDNHISLVNYKVFQRTDGIKVYNNVFDILGPRAKGSGYCIELSVHDAEVYNNWFNGGANPIINWGDRQLNSWKIHHNTFYGAASAYPTAIITSYKGNLNDVSIYNNTVEMTGRSTVNFIEFNNGGKSENIRIKNNLIINSNTEYEHYPNRFISLQNGATVIDLQVSHNLLFNIPFGNVADANDSNLTVDPLIIKSGARPTPYYLPLPDSPLIDAGSDVGLPFRGKAPDIGAYEY